MSTTLAKAYVQIIPSAKGIKGSITKVMGGEATAAGKSAGSSFGSGFVGIVKNAIIAAGIGKVIGSALSEGANLQQSLGGVETLFKDSADKMKQYASEAYKTTGLSANAYMQTVTGFSASLLQSLGGDTAAAAEAANTAMVDMADNANKMGTSMELIQNAYQGFAKQNYTMLDNLKLGYGGTKEEMKRLLADAQELSGVKYDISNLSDIYDAIHVIQGEMGISGRTAEEVAEIYKRTGREVSEQLGTTAKEASTTLSGSMASMKAAFSNVLGNLALGEDIGPSLHALSETVSIFFTQNLIPMLASLIMGLPQALSGVITIVVDTLNFAKNNAGDIVNMGIEFIGNLVTGLITGVPALMEAALGLAMALGNSIINTDWTMVVNNLLTRIKESLNISGGEILGNDTSIITSLANSIVTNLPVILNKGVDVITSLTDGILQSMVSVYESSEKVISEFLGIIADTLPSVLQAGVEVILNLTMGILNSIPSIIESSRKIIGEFLGVIIDTLPSVLQAGVDIVLRLTTGLINSLPNITNSAIKLIAEILTTITGKLPEFLQSGLTIVGELIAGLIKAIPDLVAAVPKIISGIVDTFKGFDWASIGISIIEGICKGLSSALGTIVEAVKGVAQKALDAAIGFFGGGGKTESVNSVKDSRGTSRVLSANQLLNNDTGEDESQTVKLFNAIKRNQAAISTMESDSTNKEYGGGFSQNITIYSPTEMSPYEVARQTKNATQNIILNIKRN